MMNPPLVSILVAALLVGRAQAASPAKTAKRRPSKTAFSLQSPAFKAGGIIPDLNTCRGEDASPPLAWTQAPRGTKSFALIMDDPDAPAGTWIHWVLYDLPPEAAALPAGLPKAESLPDGSKHGRSWGVDAFERSGYYGPCPPPGRVHHYSFRLYALDRILGLPPAQTNKAALLKAMKGHILGQAELVGLYRR